MNSAQAVILIADSHSGGHVVAMQGLFQYDEEHAGGFATEIIHLGNIMSKYLVMSCKRTEKVGIW